MIRSAWFTSLLLLVALLTACGSYTEIDSAKYVLSLQNTSVQKTPGFVSLEIDRTSNTAVFQHSNGTTIRLQLEMKRQEQWLKGCPGNYASSTMQTMRLKTNQLKLGGITIPEPILYMNCMAPQPTGRESQLILRSASILKEGYASGVCSTTNGQPDPNCLTFVKTN